MPSVARRRQAPRVKNAIYIALQKGRQQRMQVSEPIETCGCTSIPNDSGDSSPARPEKSSGSRDSPPAQLERSSPAARNGYDSGDSSLARSERFSDSGDSSPAQLERSSPAARNGYDSGDSSPARPERSSDSGDSSPAQPERSSPAARNGSATDSQKMSPWEQYSRLAALSKDDRPLAHVLEWHPLLRQTPAFASCLEIWIAYPTKALEYAILQEASCWPDVRQKACVVPSTLKPDRHSIFAAFERSVSSR